MQVVFSIEHIIKKFSDIKIILITSIKCYHLLSVHKDIYASVGVSGDSEK